MLEQTKFFRCPNKNCSKKITSPIMIKGMSVIACPSCGIVFVPAEVRAKLVAAKSSKIISPTQSSLIVPA